MSKNSSSARKSGSGGSGSRSSIKAKEDEDGAGSGSGGIDTGMLEKRLEALRDTQESVQGLSIWCQANKKYSTPIIDTWLKVLRKSPIEKRLTMFYLANDIVQHAKRKGDGTVVNQWAVAVQKATPHVRTPSSISNAISRIFRIWEERGIYSKDAVADLLSLLNKHTVSGKEKAGEAPTRKPETYTASGEKVTAFQPPSLSAKVKQAYRLKSHLGVTFRSKQYVNMNMDQLMSSIKDRQHGMEVVEEITSLLDQCRTSETKLLNEVDERRKIVEAAEVGIVYYENVRSEARIVSQAYKSFADRVLKTMEKVDEKLRAFDEMEMEMSPSPTHSPSHHNSKGSFPLNVIQGLDVHALQSIKLPPGKRPPDLMSGELEERPPDDVPWTNTTHSPLKPLMSNSSAVDSPHTHPHAHTGYSTMAGMSDSSIQQLAQAQLLSAEAAAASATAPPSSWAQWTNDHYLLQFQQQYQQQMASPTPPPTPAPPALTSRSGQPFALTPSMQLQMQMQTGYGGYATAAAPAPSAPDLSSIPLPPGPNPPLPPSAPEEKKGQGHGVTTPGYSSYSSQPEWMENNNDYDGHQNVNHYSQGQGQSHRYHPYNQGSPTGNGGRMRAPVNYWGQGQGQMTVRSPNPGYSPRNPLLGQQSPTTIGGGDRFPSPGKMNTSAGSYSSGEAEGMGDPSQLSPETGKDHVQNYGYNSMGYSSESGASSGMNGNDEVAFTQYQSSPPFQKPSRGQGFSPQRGARMPQTLLPNPTGGRGRGGRGGGGGGFMGRGGGFVGGRGGGGAGFRGGRGRGGGMRGRPF